MYLCTRQKPRRNWGGGGTGALPLFLADPFSPPHQISLYQVCFVLEVVYIHSPTPLNPKPLLARGGRGGGGGHVEVRN